MESDKLDYNSATDLHSKSRMKRDDLEHALALSTIVYSILMTELKLVVSRHGGRNGAKKA